MINTISSSVDSIKDGKILMPRCIIIVKIYISCKIGAIYLDIQKPSQNVKIFYLKKATMKHSLRFRPLK